MFSISKLKKGVRQPFCLSKAGGVFSKRFKHEKRLFFQAKNL